MPWLDVLFNWNLTTPPGKKASKRHDSIKQIAPKVLDGVRVTYGVSVGVAVGNGVEVFDGVEVAVGTGVLVCVEVGVVVTVPVRVEVGVGDGAGCITTPGQPSKYMVVLLKCDECPP